MCAERLASVDLQFCLDFPSLGCMGGLNVISRADLD